jgi:tripartite-type tricarboxylate transporter receptor subunit TctC
MSKRSASILAAALGALLAVGGGGESLAQPAWQTNPIRIISSQAAGGGIDAILRVVALKFQEKTGQPLVVDPRPGASGILAGSACAKAPPDGTTICLLMTSQLLLSNVLYSKPQFDALKDLTPITTLVDAPTALAVHHSIPVTTFAELVSYSQQHRGKLNYVGLGRGNPSTVAVEWMKKQFDVDWTNIAYRGAGDGLQGFATGDSQIMYVGALNVIPFVQGGTGRALFVPGAARLAQLPDAPTMKELGLPETGIIPTTYGIFAPVGTPPGAVVRMRKELAAIIQSPELKERLNTAAVLAVGEESAAFAQHLAAEHKRIVDIVEMLKLPKLD